MKKYIFFVVGVMCTLLSHTAYAIDLNKSDANIIGHVLEKKTGEHLPYMTVALKGTTIGTMTDGTGHYFLKNLPEGEFILSVSAVGYKPQERKVTLKRGKTLEENFELEEDMVALDGVVVTANRNETARRLAPTLVKVVTPKLFDMTNSHTLSQGLVFQPGVRVENDCQNCGYSQVRINGMDGKYTQILIDSRPIFSALAGVYGLEQIEHSINTGGLKFSAFSKDQKHAFNAYASAQHIVRDSYYSAYGHTTDFTGVLGAQYIYHFDKLFFMPSDLTGGVEFNHDNLDDKATDMQKYRDAALAEDPTATGDRLQQLIDKYTPDPLKQIVNIASAYVQNEWKSEQWSFLIGGRLDKNSIMSKAIFSPRANIRYNPTQDINIRFSYAEGFRAPQAFDEDLHISNVGGELISIVRAKDLKEERSRSVNASMDWYHYFGDFQANLLIEGFFTKLSDPFVLTAPVEDPKGSGYLIQTRVNGSGAKVYGGTLEGKIAWRDKIQLQAGLTVQRSLYDSPEEWSADKEHLSDEERHSDRILRTPDVYGYFTATFNPTKALSVALNGNYTGRMYVPHLMSEVDGTADLLVKSPDFFELGAKVAYDIDFSGMCLQFNVGVQNIFNSYQKDFDKGATRDSGYIYGPGAPRSYFAGVKLSF